MKQFLYIVTYWLPIIIYCLLIFIQSSFPYPATFPKLPYIDKLVHFVEYAILGVLFLRAFRTLQVKNKKRLLIVLSAAASIIYGLSDEFHQYYIPYRNASFMDIAADTAGSIFGVFVAARRL
ncbi:MAG: VanZ family protein [Deltaproteobacteria bacterium]|nr:VanZ family protein [Deltaproteobacteria bacterium]